MKRIVLVVLILVACVGIARAQNSDSPLTVKYMNYGEVGTKSNYYFNSVGAEKDGVRLQYDWFNTGNRRLWVNMFKFPVVKSDSFNLTFYPGVFVVNNTANPSKNRFCYGGFLDADASKIGLKVHYRVFAGKADFHSICSTLKLGRVFALRSDYYMCTGKPGFGYIGPQISGLKISKDSDLMIFYGLSTVTPGAYATHACLTVKF